MAHAPKTPDSPLFDLYLKPFFLSLVLAGTLGWLADHLRQGTDLYPVGPAPAGVVKPGMPGPASAPASHDMTPIPGAGQLPARPASTVVRS